MVEVRKVTIQIIQVLELTKDDPADTFAFHQGEAFEYLATNKSDELLEKILQGKPVKGLL